MVLDTSVWVNLLATGRPWDILEALGARAFVPEPVIREVRRDPRTGATFAFDQSHPLRCQARVEVVALSNVELEAFVAMVSAPAPDALGDGEAAAIAAAVSRNAVLCLDERKASRVVREQFPSVEVRRTVDLLCDAAVRSKLGDAATQTCFADAKRLGRMHVPKDFVLPWANDAG